MRCEHLNQTDRFCSDCGARLLWQCVDCRSWLHFSVQARFCQNCGKSMPEWLRDFRAHLAAAAQGGSDG